jgi:hypothetical protein
MALISYLVIGFGSLSFLCLLVLHFVSPEFKPSWRMISEYALGKHKWLITLFFVFWAMASALLAFQLWGIVNGLWARVGVVLVFVSGIGELMGGLFDVKHKLHGFAFFLGIPTLPIGALLIANYLITFEQGQLNEMTIVYSTHSLWISVIFMAGSLALLMTGFKKTGQPMGPGIEPPKELPKGVIGLNGYFNRILVFCYISWLIIISYSIN